MKGWKKKRKGGDPIGNPSDHILQIATNILRKGHILKNNTAQLKNNHMDYFLFGVFKLLDNKTHHHNIAASLVVTIIKKVMDNPDKKHRGQSLSLFPNQYWSGGIDKERFFLINQ